MQWEIPASFDGPAVPMNGTVQEVVAKLRELDPHFDESLVPGHDDLQKRTDFTGSSHSRYSRWDLLTSPKYINDGIRYLRKVRGVPSAGPGPGKSSPLSKST